MGVLETLKSKIFDVIIVGAGPSGLFAAFYSGMRGMDTAVMECQPMVGGKLNFYGEKIVWDAGGHPPILASQLCRQLSEQAQIFEPQILFGEKIVQVSQSAPYDSHDNNTAIGTCFRLSSETGRDFYSRSVIMAIGSGVVKPKLLSFDEGHQAGQRFAEGNIANLHYRVSRLDDFIGKVVMISGGGHSALDWAGEISQVARAVHLVYRKAEFEGHENLVQRLKSSIHCYLETSIVGLELNKKDLIEAVQLESLHSGSSFSILVDCLLVSHGFDRDDSLLQQSPLPNLNLDEGRIAGDALAQTGQEGIFAAGDVLRFPGKVNLLAGCFQDAVNAVNRAKSYIDPAANGKARVSSHNAVFEERNAILFAAKKQR